LTRISLDGSGSSRLAAGERARDFSIAGSRLVFSERQDDVDLWRIGGPGADSPGAPEPWPSSTRDDHFPDYSPDGDRVAFISGRDGHWDVWVAEADGSNPRRLSDLGHATRPRWAPDGSLIAFNVASVDTTDIYLVDPAMGAPRSLTKDDLRNAIPGWSDDSQWIYFQSRGRAPGPEAVLWEIWKMRRDGGDLTRITDAWGLRPVHYKGRVYVVRIEDGRVVSHPEDGGEATEMVDYPINHAGWDLWRGKLVFMERGEPGTAVIKIFDPETGMRVHATVRVPGSGWLRTEGTLTVSTDGQYILYSAKGKPGGADLILVESFH